MDKIKFSILIPAYKSAFLEECIESVLTQEYRDFEIIVLNDHSPENIPKIIKQYKDSRIKYFENNSNVGAINVVNNWNKCLQYSSGNYVICIGDDDKLLPNCLTEYNSIIQANPGIGLIHGWTEIIDEHSNVTSLTCKRCLRDSAMSLLWHRSFLFSHQYIGDFCFNKEVLLENNGFYYLPMAWGSDDITALLCAQKNGVINTQIPVFQYRVNSQTISKTGNGLIKMEALLLREKWMHHFLEKKCKDTCDELYRLELIEYQSSYFNRIKIDTISIDIRNQSLLRIFKWFYIRKKYNISLGLLLKAFIISIK